MAFPGETIATGAAATCSTCGVTPELNVYQSPGSREYYIGTYCKCGPYSRESEYFKTKEAAQGALDKWKKGDTTGIRTTDFNREGAAQLEVIEVDKVDG